jgi:hypothetical protein
MSLLIERLPRKIPLLSERLPRKIPLLSDQKWSDKIIFHNALKP